MASVYLGLGSNIDPEENLRLAVHELESRYGALELSPVYRSTAVGFAGDDFLNLVVGMHTDEPAESIHDAIEQIHTVAGRERGSNKFGARTLDIDLLLYDDLVIEHPKFSIPRKDVLEYSFVLRPLAELAPDLIHPETGRRIGEHWREAAPDAQPLAPVTVDLHG